MFIAAVAIETALTAVDSISWFRSDDFDYYAFILFAVVFMLYTITFVILAGWKRHWESRKLYMDR